MPDELPTDEEQEYTVTLAAWMIFNIAMVLATHRARRRRPWL